MFKTDQGITVPFGFIPYIKTALTMARVEPSGQPFTVYTQSGDELQGKALDYHCAGVPNYNDQWIVDADIFNKTYAEVVIDTNDCPVPPAVLSWAALNGFRFYRKTSITFAQQVTHAGVIMTLEGPVEHEALDYICYGAKGEMWPQSKERFEANYKAAVIG